MSKFFDLPVWKRLLVLVTGQVILPPLTWAGRWAAKSYPDAGDVLVRSIALHGKKPVAEVLKDIHFKAVAEVVDLLESGDISPSFVDDVASISKIKGIEMWLVLIHHSIEGFTRPVNGPPQEADMDFVDKARKESIDWSTVEGIATPDANSIAQWVAYEVLKETFKIKKDFSKDSLDVSIYVSTGKGRRTFTSKDLIQQWIDRGSVTEGQLATAGILH